MQNKGITLSQKTWVGDISPIKDYKTSTISSKRVICTNLSPKESYIAQ